MNNTKNNHYVPQFIMKNWRNNKGNAFICEIKNGNEYKFSKQRNFFKTNSRRKLYEESLEQKLSEIENETANLVRKLEKNYFKIPFLDLETYQTYLMQRIIIINIQWGHRNHLNPYTINYLDYINLYDYKFCYYTYKKKKLICPYFFFQFKTYHINNEKYNILLQPLSPSSMVCCLPKNISSVLNESIKQYPIFVNNLIASNVVYEKEQYEKYIGCSHSVLLELANFIKDRKIKSDEIYIDYNENRTLDGFYFL